MEWNGGYREYVLVTLGKKLFLSLVVVVVVFKLQSVLQLVLKFWISRLWFQWACFNRKYTLCLFWPSFKYSRDEWSAFPFWLQCLALVMSSEVAWVAIGNGSKEFTTPGAQMENLSWLLLSTTSCSESNIHNNQLQRNCLPSSGGGGLA